MRTLRTAIAGILALLAVAPAAAQLPNIQDHAVWGRIGSPASDGGSGPSQAVPFVNLQQQLGVHTLPEIYASDPAYGVKCDGVTDDAPALQLAVNAAATAANGTGAWVVLPSGTCEIYSNIFRNTSTTPGILTVPGIKIRGQDKGVTKLDTHVASDFLISANPAWRVAHQAAFSTTTSTSGGSLGTNTYYLQITANDGLGHEIVVTSPKSFSVTGPTGSLSVPIPALSNPGWTYTLYCDTASTPAHYCGLGGGDATGRTPGQTIVVTSVGTAHVAPTTPVAVWQEASIRDLSITNSAGTASASGISYFKVGYSDLTNVYMKGLTGDGFSEKAYTGDIDGSFNTGIHGSKFDTINGTCVDATAAVLEQTSFTVDALSAFNVCGTAPANIGTAVTISSIQNSSSPSVFTSTAHNFQARDQIAFTVTGTTLASAYYRVGDTVTSNSFNLVDLNGVAVDTTSLGAFVSGTVTLSWRPPQIVNGAITGGGGCLAWAGLIGTLRNTNFTQCNNFAFYASENGSNDNLTIENVDVENTAGKGFYIGAVVGGTLKNFECLSTTSAGKTIACVQEGTGFTAGGVQNFLIDVGKVRSDATPSTAFEQFANTNFGATFTDTNRVRNITWTAFDAAGQTRTSGFVYDSIFGGVQFSISAANTAKLIPLGYGGCLPIHLKSPGEWVCYHVPSAGITGAVTGGLTPATSYNCYARNSAANTSPYSIAFACNAHATALNEGYSVDSTDGSWSFIGTATTDGSGNFQTTGAQTSWYPATGASAPGNFSVGGNLTVVGTSNLNGLVTDGNGELMTNIAAPSTPAGGFDRLWSDSTDKRLHDKNDAGTIGTTVVADTGASNNFLTAISAAGAISKAQPSFSNLSGSNTAAQIAGSAASHAVPIDVAGTPTWKVISDCNGATTALNYTQSSDAFSCNSSVNAATLGGATFSAPGAIGGGTPSTGAFTTVTSGAHTVTSASANALAVGANGTTNPAFNVDDSTASSATGVNIKSAAAAAGVAMSVLSSGTDEGFKIDAKGAGLVNLASVSTGGVKVGAGSDASSITGTLLYLSNNGTTSMTIRNSSAHLELFFLASTSQAFFGTSTAHDLVIRANNTNAITVSATDESATFASSTASSSPTTGSGIFGGGIGVSGNVWATGNHAVSVAAKTLLLKQGANGAVGTFVCTSGGSITVSNTNVAVSDAIIISLNTVGGTVSTAPALNAITAATSFVAKCATSDTSTYNYAIIKNAA